jgi:hypothetical protein
MDVLTAVITAKEKNMNTSSAGETAQVAKADSEQPKATKKARVAPQRAHVAKKKGKSAKKDHSLCGYREGQDYSELGGFSSACWSRKG